MSNPITDFLKSPEFFQLERFPARHGRQLQQVTVLQLHYSDAVESASPPPRRPIAAAAAATHGIVRNGEGDYGPIFSLTGG